MCFVESDRSKSTTKQKTMAQPKLLNSYDLEPFLANPVLVTEQTRELQLAIANYPATPTNLLEILVNSSDPLVAEAASHHINWAGEITENWQQIADTTLQTKELRQNDHLAVELLKIAPVADYFLSEFVPVSYLSLALKNPHLPLRYRVKYLERLARESNIEPRLQVAECRETPVSMLEILAGDLELPIRMAVKSNFITPPELIELVEEQLAVAQDWNTDSEQLATSGESRWDLIRLAVAQNPATSGETLMQLARDAVFKIKFAVAKNPQTPGNVLAVLMENSGGKIKSVVARHPNVTEEMLHQLFANENSVLRERENLPASILERFFQEAATDEPIWKQYKLRHLLLRQSNTPSWILAELANVDIEAVRAEKKALKPKKSEVLETWVRDEIRFLGDVAKHPQVSVEILEQLSNCPHPEVQLAVAQNSRTPELLQNQILLRLALGDDEGVVRAIASSPKTPAPILESLIKNDVEYYQIFQLAGEIAPNASEELLHKIINFVKKYGSPRKILSRLRDKYNRDSVLKKWREILASLNESERSAIEPLCRCMLPAIGLGGGLPLQDRWLEKYHPFTSEEFTLYGLLMLLGLTIENPSNRGIPVALVGNPNTPPPLQEELKNQLLDSTNKNQTDVIVALAYNSAIPEAERLKYFKQLLSTANDRTKENIGGNPDTPTEILAQLMTKLGVSRQAVSLNPNAPASALAELAQDGNNTTREWVAKNPGTPVEVLLKLATQPLEKSRNSRLNNYTIWDNVLNNPSLPILERYRLLLEKEREEEIAEADRFMSTRLRRRSLLVDMSKSSAFGTDSRTSHHNPYNAARNYGTPINILEQLAKHPDENVRSALLDRQTLSSNIMLELVCDSSVSVRSKLAKKNRHRKTPGEILEMLADDESEKVRELVAENPDTPVEVLVKLGNDSSENVKKKLVSNPNTPSNVLEKAVRKLWDRQKQRSAASTQKELAELLRCNTLSTKSSQIPASVLDELSHHGYSVIRRHVTINPNTPSKALERLCKDNDSTVRAGVARHPNTQPHVLEKMARREDPKDKSYHSIISCIARHQNTPPTVLEFLANNSANIRQIVAANPNTPSKTLESLATTESDIEILKALIRNPNLTARGWQKLAADENTSLREAIASSSNTPINILEALALDTDRDVRRKVAANPNTPTTSLEILSQDSITEVRIAVAGNQNTNVIVLEQLGQDEKVEVRRAVAKNPNTPAPLQESLEDLLGLPYVRQPSTTLSGLSRIYKPDTDDLPTLLSEYAQSDNAFVRFVTLMHPLTPVDNITEGCQSLFWQERYAVADNSSTPGEIREQLANDGNRIVRATAKANL
ncbi:MAG: hypothetical protein F6K39_15655 [Okeania sp. SIO3B3]|nr:hypothetical protein [Okeania sp. SIO3B3]